MDHTYSCTSQCQARTHKYTHSCFNSLCHKMLRSRSPQTRRLKAKAFAVLTHLWVGCGLAGPWAQQAHSASLCWARLGHWFLPTIYMSMGITYKSKRLGLYQHTEFADKWKFKGISNKRTIEHLLVSGKQYVCSRKGRSTFTEMLWPGRVQRQTALTRPRRVLGLSLMWNFSSENAPGTDSSHSPQWNILEKIHFYAQ